MRHTDSHLLFKDLVGLLVGRGAILGGKPDGALELPLLEAGGLPARNGGTSVV